MSDFREAQNSANPNKVNVLMSAIILVLILAVALQIWLMYGALNNALDNDHKFAWATFIGSGFLFFACLFLLKYLPEPREKKKKNPNNQYE